MSIFSDGGPAFPVATDFSRVNEGMTLRDYFAAAALQGMLVNSEWEDIWLKNAPVHAYKYADAMITARGKKKRIIK